MIEDDRKELRVLVVEDEDRLRDVLVRAIPQMGFGSIGVRSAEEARRLLEKEPFGVLILDLNLPGEDGLSFFQSVRERWPDKQVIILTGFGDLEAARQAIHLDVVDFLTKPCSLGDLEIALDRARKRLTDPDALPRRPGDMNEDEDGDRAVPSPAGTSGSTELEGQPLRNVEKAHILAALARNEGNRQATADELGISVRTLYYRLSEYQKEDEAAAADEDGSEPTA